MNFWDYFGSPNQQVSGLHPPSLTQPTHSGLEIRLPRALRVWLKALSEQMVIVDMIIKSGF